ncbi:VOC family protein [Actinophytocola sp.]|uniref:VOC family protein n=1 Tax=Actinophytocola sp. TaxID=1872138 RepID=UPI00389A4DDA
MVRWSHVALNCGDLDTTEKFYTELFGFHRANEFTVGSMSIVFLRLGDARLELFCDPAAAPQAPGTAGQDGPDVRGTVRHVAFQVDDLAKFLAGPAATAEVTLGPLDFAEFIPGWRTVWLRDPDGVVVEVSQGYRDAAAYP